MTPEEKAFIDEIERVQVQNDAYNELVLYNNTGDARFFWRAFLFLHEARQPIPENMLAKMAEWASKVIATEAEGVAEALELAGDRKRKIGPKHGEAYRRRWRLASDVKLIQQQFGIRSVSEAQRIVARNNHTTFDRVKKAYDDVFRKPGRIRKPSKSATLAQAMKAWR